MSNYMSRLADRLVGESSMHAGGSVRKGDGRHGKVNEASEDIICLSSSKSNNKNQIPPFTE